jgi:hypothetical protein
VQRLIHAYNKHPFNKLSELEVVSSSSSLVVQKGCYSDSFPLILPPAGKKKQRKSYFLLLG